VYDFMEISRQYMDFMTTHSSDVFYILDENLKYVYISPSVFQLRGVTQEEALTQQTYDHYTEESLKRVKTIYSDYIQRLDQNQREQHFIKRVYLELKKKPSGTVHVESTVKMVAKYGKIQYICGLTRDVSKVIENNFLKGVVEMAGATCHEFSQPFQVISGCVDLIEHKMNNNELSTEELRKYVSRIKTQIERTADLLNKSRAIIRGETELKNKKYDSQTKIVDLS